MVGGLASLEELYVWSLELVMRPFETFPLRAHVLSFQISIYSFAITIGSALPLASPIREVSWVRYTPRAWDPRSL